MELPIGILLPDGFLDTEVRCDYTVTSNMKAVWAVELDLYKKLENICQKHSIKYFADGGTILGCVRHGGYIPWDDDIDIAMFREDYEKFRQVAPAECTYPYYFQDEYTDRGSLLGHGQLKNSATTYLNPALPSKCNQGIFIDIFPLDAVPDSPELFEKMRRKLDKYKKSIGRISSITDCYNKNKPGIKNKIKGLIHPLSPVILKVCDYHSIYKEFEGYCQMYNHEYTEYISLLSFQHGWNRLIRKRKDYQEFVPMKFEFVSIPVIKEYDDTLKRLYGNYQEMVIGTSAHRSELIDPYRPFTTYIKENQR